MPEFNWSDPAFAGEYITWADGVSVVGYVVDVTTHTFEANDRGPGRTVPKVLVDVDGHVTEITCGPADLRKKMIAAQPQKGDRIRIEVIGSTKTQVGTQFFFKVDVRKGGTPIQAQPAVNELVLPADAEPPF